MPCLSLVKPGLAFHTQFGVLNPVEHEERALDTVDFTEDEIHPVLLPIGFQLAQDCGGQRLVTIMSEETEIDLVRGFAWRLGMTKPFPFRYFSRML